ncbi:formylglycine-generating enzyme family protein [Orrella sp. 11846]|uniref:formylglycine-generating enzyme family protein n=1 Tax=Orrella sp. 11846 TaxID=3409913 RepID=UPI003B5C6DB1
MKVLSSKNIGIMSAAVLLAMGAGSSLAANTQTQIPQVSEQKIPAGTFQYQIAGSFVENGLPTDAPSVQGAIDKDIRVMTRQVSQAEYMQCVSDGACGALDKGFRNFMSGDAPAVGISWLDATDYAKWLSEKTGQDWRLPTYEEWVRAAADKYEEEGTLESAPDNPAVRWLAEYDRETSRRQDRIKATQPFGYFGTNEYGLQDMAGNVWEWTDTCFHTYRDGEHVKENCGVRVLAGAHVAAMPDFIRDPKTGACSIGLPPTNLGFRLVRDDR